MSDVADRGGPERLSASDERAMVLLALLQAEAPRPAGSLSEAVMRTARWQYALRGTLGLLDDVSGALLEGALLVCGLRGTGVRS